jgi:predicted  nucleic acid-binding Zn-ribbon protein
MNTAQQKISDELDYSILNLELDINTFKTMMNRAEKKEMKEALERKLSDLNGALDALQIKKGFFDEIRGLKKN